MSYTCCCVYCEKLLMMDRGTVRNVQSFIPKINLRKYTIAVCSEKLLMMDRGNVRNMQSFIPKINLRNLPLLGEQLKNPNDGQRNCPKHVEFHSKNKFEKIYHFCVYSEKLLMMDRGSVRNMQSFIPKINFRNQCIQLVLIEERRQ